MKSAIGWAYCMTSSIDIVTVSCKGRPTLFGCRPVNISLPRVELLFNVEDVVIGDCTDCKEFDGPTSNGSNLVGDSIVLPPLTDPAKSDNVSGLEWNELIEEDVSSVMDGMKGVLSVVVGFCTSVKGRELPLAIIGEG